MLTGDEDSYDYNVLIPLISSISSQATFKELLKQSRQIALDCYNHQHYPIKKVLRQLDREDEYQTLFRTVVLLEGIHHAPDLRGVEDFSGVDLCFAFRQDNKKIHGNVTYNAARFFHASIQHIVRHFLNALEQAAERLDLPAGRIEFCSDREKQQILEEFNVSSQDIPVDATLHQRFLKQAAGAPGRVAAVLGHGHVTYGFLESRSAQLCAFLTHEAHLPPGALVGILMDRTLELPAVILGIAGARGAFVPIDPSLPEQFMRRLIVDTNLDIVISQRNYIRLLDRLQWSCPSLQSYLCIDSRDIWSEQEITGGGLMDRKLWEYIGKEAVDDVAGGGWISSFTGRPFSVEEMAEFGDNVLGKLRPVVNDSTRVLEIGCATGYTMYRVAPLVKDYIGADLSSIIIEKNRERIGREGIANIRLAVASAEEVYGVTVFNGTGMGPDRPGPEEYEASRKRDGSDNDYEE